MQALGPIQNHLQVYNFRKKVEVAPCPELSVWAVLPGQKPQDPPGERPPIPVVVCSPDPRVPVMGWRIVAGTKGNITDLLPKAQPGSYEEYCKHRYEHGGYGGGVENLVMLLASSPPVTGWDICCFGWKSYDVPPNACLAQSVTGCVHRTQRITDRSTSRYHVVAVTNHGRSYDNCTLRMALIRCVLLS